MTAEKQLGDIAVAAKFETVTALTTAALDLSLRAITSASNRYLGDNLQRTGLRELAAL
jgi:hypothetical protein